MAYCEWLTGEWRASGQIDPSDVVRSPNEPEWKKAARGVDGQTYPWGDERPHPQRCNFGIAAKGTTPVGQYSPQGDSPYGCVGTAGNVWEWTLSLFGKNDRTPEFEYPYDPSDGWEDLGAGDDVYRVIRGDARYFSATNARAAKRRAQLPDGRYVNTGFRVVVSSGSR